MASSLFTASRWLFLALLVFAPWAYGCTEAWAIRWLNAGMAVVFLLWIDSHILRGTRPAIRRLPLVCTLVLLGLGWLAVLNPRSVLDPETHTFSLLKPLLPGAPSTIDHATSFRAMLRLSALLGMLLVVSDLATSAPWRRRLWWTIAGTGISIVLLGIVQRVGAAPMIFWEDRTTQASFFATYYYAGNGGAFLNLVLTPIAGLAYLATRHPDAHVHRAIWIPGWLLCLAAAFVNTSRTAQTITLALTGVFAFSQARAFLASTEVPRRSVCAIYAGAIAAAIGALVFFGGWQKTAAKWGVMQSQLNADNPRWQALQAAVQMLPDAGLFGLGPGTFAEAFPHYTGPLGASIAGIWRYTHNDYLQTAIEWGAVGALVWAVLFLGGVWRCFSCGRRPGPRTHDRLILLCAGLSLAGVMLHALIDFPLQIASLQLYVVTFLGLAWSPAAESPAAESHARH